MRLIDADELIKKFRYSDAHTEDENVWCATFRRMIKEQPTAYDIEIERIKADFAHELKEKFNIEIPSNYSSTQPFFTLENVRALVDEALKEQK